MSFFSSSKNKEEVVLLIDIGNGSMGGALVYVRHPAIPLVMYTMRLPFTVVDNLDASKLIEEASSLLEEMLKNLVEKGFSPEYWKGKQKEISSVLVTFSSPWFASKAKHIIVSEEKPFLVTKPFLASLIQKEGELFIAELGGGQPVEQSNGVINQAFELIENSVVHTKINGYTLENSMDKRTTSFEAFLSMSAVPQSVAEIIRNFILKHTPVRKEKIFLHSFPLVSFSLIRDLYSGLSDFIIMDITGEVTDMTLVSEGAVAQTVSFPSGKHFLIRQVAKALDVTPELALSTLHMCAWGKADDMTVAQVGEVLNEIEKEWSIYFEDAITSLSPSAILPTSVFVTADADTAQFFIDFIKMPKTDRTSIFRKGANIVHLNHEVLGKLYEINTKLVPDEFMGILAIFYDKMSRN